MGGRSHVTPPMVLAWMSEWYDDQAVLNLLISGASKADGKKVMRGAWAQDDISKLEESVTLIYGNDRAIAKASRLYSYFDLPPTICLGMQADLWNWCIALMDDPNPSWLAENDIPATLYSEFCSAMPASGHPKPPDEVFAILDKLTEVYRPYSQQCSQVASRRIKARSTYRREDIAGGGLSAKWWRTLDTLVLGPNGEGTQALHLPAFRC